MLKVNLLPADEQRKARRATIIVVTFFVLLVGGLSAIGAWASYRAATHGTSVFQEAGQLLALPNLPQLIWQNQEPTAKPDSLSTPDNRLNFLLLGIGGEGHDGAQLTDTIILASFDKTTQRLSLLSIPRDLAYPLGGGRFEKINAVNVYNELQHPGQGAQITAQAFAKLLNVRIDRVIKIDFKGFAEFIDAIGGIDVDVPVTFIDRSFPTDDDGPNPYRWTNVSFTKGLEHMNGKRALTFVRSRHGSNGEGSDFARSRRQQLVLKAVRERLLSLGTLANPKRVSDLWTAISNHLQTDISAWDLLTLLPIAMHFSSSNVVTHVLTDEPNGELSAGMVDGAFLLFPKKSDWSQIQAIVAHPFETPQEAAHARRPQEAISLEIKNGTLHTGLASHVSAELESEGYNVQATSNAKRRGYDQTVIYDLTNGAKPTELARLKKLLNASVVTAPLSPRGVLTGDAAGETLFSSSTHFLIILGESSTGFAL